VRRRERKEEGREKGRGNDTRKRKRMEDGVEALLEKRTGKGESSNHDHVPRARARPTLHSIKKLQI